MVSTLSIMTLADSGSEIEVLGLGISVIALNKCSTKLLQFGKLKNEFSRVVHHQTIKNYLDLENQNSSRI